MSETYKYASSGDGWWQRGDGEREPLTEIQLFFYGDRSTSGSGIDSRGFFDFLGTWLEDGRVTIRKNNFGPFPADKLIGEYDGEGTLWGTWTSDEGSGSWLIRLSELKPSDNEATMRALDRTERAWDLHCKLKGIAVTILSKDDEGEKTA
jgi:hypothetical protein